MPGGIGRKSQAQSLRARNGPNDARVLSLVAFRIVQPELGWIRHKGRRLKGLTAKAGERPKGRGERPEKGNADL